MFLNGATNSVFLSRARAPSLPRAFGCSGCWCYLARGDEVVQKSMVCPTEEALEVAYTSCSLLGGSSIDRERSLKPKLVC